MSAPSAAPILVIDDEESLRHLLRVILGRLGHAVVEAADVDAALRILDERPAIRIALCDLRMPQRDGMAFLDAVRGRPLTVVMMSAYITNEAAIEALGRGAFDYISKPFRPDEIRVLLERVSAHAEPPPAQVAPSPAPPAQMGGFLARSAVGRALLAQVTQVAAYPSTVLLTGESGTGKELLARALHDGSARAQGPFVAINVAAMPEGLLESELFGHERGAFTGAHRTHAGIFEQAHGGTLLLDELGDMPAPLQTRLLRVLQEGKVRRVGGSRDIAVDVRLIAATAKDLDAAVKSGAFREDLYYRVKVVHLHIPPLRARREDIPLLAEALVQRAARRLGKPAPRLGAEASEALLLPSWPGNVRQLEHAIESAVVRCTGDEIGVDELPEEVRLALRRASEPVDDEDLSIKRHTARLERELIERALRRTQGNRTQAARLLDLSYKALLYKIRDYAIEGGGEP
jgi:two-component system response regulator AtoC